MNARNRLPSCRNGLVLLFALIAVLPWSAARAQVTDCTDAAWDISADSLSILLGESTTLRWSYDGPSPPCQIRINGENLDDIYGSRIVQPQTSTTYVLSAQAPVQSLVAVTASLLTEGRLPLITAVAIAMIVGGEVVVASRHWQIASRPGTDGVHSET